jgi:hypothetical protein
MEEKTFAPFENHKGCGTASLDPAGSYRSGILQPCSPLQTKTKQQGLAHPPDNIANKNLANAARLTAQLLRGLVD